jgi:hypothetical protein
MASVSWPARVRRVTSPMSMLENAFMVMILDEEDEPVQEGLARTG